MPLLAHSVPHTSPNASQQQFNTLYGILLNASELSTHQSADGS